MAHILSQKGASYTRAVSWMAISIPCIALLACFADIQGADAAARARRHRFDRPVRDLVSAENHTTQEWPQPAMSVPAQDGDEESSVAIIVVLVLSVCLVSFAIIGGLTYWYLVHHAKGKASS